MSASRASAAAVHLRGATVDDSAALGLTTVSASMATSLGHVLEEDLDFGWTPQTSARAGGGW